MVVCKFFLQGNCRFGNNCRFEHSYNSKYSYHAPQSNGQPQPVPSGVTDEQLVTQVRSDILAALQGGQWILSCYAPYKEKGIIPGISDLSPEEARLFFYEARATNNVEQAITFMNNHVKETRNKYEQLLEPNMAIINTLRRIYNGENVSSPFGAQNSFGPSSNTASSVFRSAVQSTPTVFSQNNTAASIFGQANKSAFGQSPDNAQSIFAQANQSVFSPPIQNQSPFVQSPDSARSIFAQANQNVSSQNVFQAQQQNPTNVFASASQQFFGKPDAFQQTSGSPFGQTNLPFTQQNQTQNAFNIERPTNVFGNQNVFEQSTNDFGVYSNMEELTERDIEAFRDSDFKLGFIPEIPPPKALCVM